ncbi:hypothetical protein TSUD_147000 [Trifolium subterraneum]|uniref:Uncharacterized protein n=1 Tax=Trifolium subterraneum TaxID=3900 RepID=A0A2Z6MIX6_TRISU|nr:hypothetical protein TSUD_147000 [Trifolium subterraneum]
MDCGNPVFDPQPLAHPPLLVPPPAQVEPPASLYLASGPVMAQDPKVHCHQSRAQLSADGDVEADAPPPCLSYKTSYSSNTQ